MTGLLYKIDSYDKRLTDNIAASFENKYEKIYFYSKSFKEISLNKGDYFFYSDNDLEINKRFQVISIITNNKIEARQA